MKKKVLSLLLVLVFLLGLLPTMALATDNTLNFSTNLNSEYTTSSGSPFQLRVAVGSYTPAGGEATPLPAGTAITYQWYKSTDDQIDASDSKVYTQQNYAFSPAAGKNWYYVTATATIDGIEYTGTSNVACVKVPAAAKSVKVTVNDQGILGSDKDGVAVGGKSVSVADVNCDNKQTVDEVLLAAHKALLSADAYATTGSEGNLTITKIWNKETENFAVYLNGTKVTDSVDTVAIKAGDVVCISLNSGESDKYVAFDTVATTVSENKEFTLTLTDGTDAAVAGLPVGLWKDGTFEQLGDKVTDENGQVTLSFAAAGDYVVTAKASSEETPIIAPACTVTVKAKGELRFSGTLPQTTQTVYVGESVAFSLSKGGYYVNGVQDSSVKASAYTLTWYRIGADGQSQNLGTSITGKMTADDVGTWKYYAVLSGEIYGDQYNTMSDFVTVIVKEPTLPEGSAENGFVTGFASYTLGMDGLTFEEGKTDYALTELDVGTNETLHFNYAGSGLWCGVRVNGIKSTTSDYELTHTLYATGSFKIPTTFAAGQTNVVSLLVGTKYDSNGSGTIDANDDFDRYDVYNFTVTTLPGVAPITVKNSDNTAITLSKPISTSKNYFVKETSGTRTTDTVKLTATFKAANGVKLYVGDTEYTANLSNTEIDLASFKDGNGVAAVPLTAKYVGEGGAVFENTITLTLNPTPDFAAPVIKTQPAAESTVAKGGTVPLSVEAETPVEGTTLSYQWVKGLSSYAITNNAYTVIDGATSTSYVAPGEEAAKDMYYFCLVTLRKGGASATTVSDAAKVTTELTYVSAPVITIQPGICGNKSGGGTYCTEYTAGSAFDPMWMGVASESDGHSQVTERGCAPFLNDVKCYYNTVPSTEGGILVDGTAAIAGTGGSYGSYFSFTPTAGLPEGINYVYFVVTTTAADDPTKSASTTTDFVKLTYGKADFGFEGSGTAEDPFLLKTGDDFVTIRKFVEELGINCSGMCFKMANDITLPADWQSIGTNGAGGKFFGGTLDGDGHTLSYAKGSPSLIYHAKGAVITNLQVYGEEIQGPALISSSWINQTNGAWIAEISDVTLVSGSSTLESGLVNGSASTYNPITITNCTVEEGVTIGYDKTKNNIGSIAGGFIGSISNCRSAATVYGNNNIGGIVGLSANSMGAGNLTNCVFTGKIVATGNNVGGIQGSGYVAESAPNALCVCIQNCYVNAEITGKNNVGGMLGGDRGILQAWDNGPGNIRNNLFYGKLTGDSNVGGMVGYYASLNKNNHISDNYFYDANGHENIIGGVTYIDTSAHEYGMGEDGIFYFDTSRDDLETIKQVVDAKKIGTPDYQYTSIAKKDQNRSDDPMGKDKAAFGRSVTSSELTDGTVLNLLNNGEASMKNWVEGTVCPVIDNRPIATEIAVTGDFKSEYYIGEALDLSGAVFTVAFSDGTTKTVPAEDVVVTGFDSSARAVLNLTVSYQSVSTTISVKVLQKPMVNTITVYFTLLGDTLHEGDNTIHTLTGGNLTTWIDRESYEMDINATVKDLLGAVEKRHSNVKFNGKGSQYGTYIESVTYGDLTIGEFDNTATSGWMVTINGKHPDVGVDYEFLNNGDKVIFHFTDDYSKEQGGEEWNDPGTGDTPVSPSEPITEPTEQPSGEVKKREYSAESGKVPAIVNADGTKTIVKKSYADGKTAYALVPDGAKILFVDNRKSFADVKNGDWYADAIDFVTAHELFNGLGKDIFAPDMPMSRAMLVTVLYRLEDTPDCDVESAFRDVLIGDWYADAVLWAAANKITDGMGDGSFGADLDVTREQIATFLYRYAKYIGLDVSASGSLEAFPDGGKVSGWAQAAMQWAVGTGLFRGDDHGMLNPGKNATRAEVATLLMRLVERIVK